MKHMQADKYTIAWFKIADCVSRGEKERALGVYRLLSHSFNDDALSRQLEADIYLSCNEQERAVSLYRQAIEGYKKSKRFVEAAALYEHLIFLLPHDSALKREIMLCYHEIAHMNAKIYPHFQEWIKDHRNKQAWAVIEHFMQESDYFTPVVQSTMCHYVIEIFHKTVECHSLIMLCVEKPIKRNNTFEHEQSVLQGFLDNIRSIDELLFEYACAYLQKVSL